MSTDMAIKNASASLKMEGLIVTDELKALFVRKNNNEISMDEYIQKAMEIRGVKI